MRRAGLAGCVGVTGLAQAARDVVGPGEMRCDELCPAAGVGTLVGRGERAYGDGRSAGCGGGSWRWRCWGNDREKP